MIRAVRIAGSSPDFACYLNKEHAHVLLFPAGQAGGGYKHLRPRLQGRSSVPWLQHATEVIVDHLDVLPAELLKPLLHGVLKLAALLIVDDLIGG